MRASAFDRDPTIRPAADAPVGMAAVAVAPAGRKPSVTAGARELWEAMRDECGLVPRPKRRRG